MTTETAPPRRDPVQDAAGAERAEARALMQGATFAALAWTDARDGTPGISRVAFGFDSVAGMLLVVSGLAGHTPALKAQPACALMVGEITDRGDAMNHPRLMVRARAEFIARDEGLRARWLERNPKAKVYIDLPDFSFVRLHAVSATLNGGFARAFRLTAEDLAP